MSTFGALSRKIALAVLPDPVLQPLRREFLSRRVLSGACDRGLEPLRLLVGPGDVAADIGANAGIYTRQLSLAVGPAGRVFAFEPVRSTYTILRQVVEKGGLDNVTALRLAVGARQEVAQMVVPDLGFEGFYLAHLAAADDPATPSARTEPVDVVTLDHFVETSGAGRLDFVKCDVEGRELDVLDGAAVTLRHHRPAWLIEIARAQSAEVFSRFQQAGYQGFVFAGGSLVRVDSYRDGRYSDYYFLHPASTHWQRASALGVATALGAASGKGY